MKDKGRNISTVSSAAVRLGHHSLEEILLLLIFSMYTSNLESSRNFEAHKRKSTVIVARARFCASGKEDEFF